LYRPDGGAAEEFLHVPGLVQVSAENGTARPHLPFGIENTRRRRDLTGPTEKPDDRKVASQVGGSGAFRKFIREELIPQVGERYRTTPERAIVGKSLAGVFVVETFLLDPDLFDAYLAIDPSLWWNDQGLVRATPARLRSHPRLEKRLYLASSDEKEIAEATRAVGGHPRHGCPRGPELASSKEEVVIDNPDSSVMPAGDMHGVGSPNSSASWSPRTGPRANGRPPNGPCSRSTRR